MRYAKLARNILHNTNHYCYISNQNLYTFCQYHSIQAHEHSILQWHPVCHIHMPIKYSEGTKVACAGLSNTVESTGSLACSKMG